jgi:glycerol-3-phosphate dehydrogenase
MVAEKGCKRVADFDLAIIGGGINGAGIARDAAGRGLRVLLVEQDDLASGTSSASTKLIHGGLRYLEHGAFRLVREALAEREVLLRMAPHLVRPMRFVLPHHNGLRPRWILRLGLWMYDHLGGRELLPPARSVDLRTGAVGAPLQSRYSSAFEYSDCWVDDARLVVLNAVDAFERGADIRPRTRCMFAERIREHWELTLQGETGRERASARALLNAAGPWVEHVSQHVLGMPVHAPIRLVKGSHIVVPKLFTHDRAYLFQNADGRVVFAIPYEDGFTLIGTTDIDYEGDPAAASISSAEAEYLCGSASDYFRQEVTTADVVWSYTGVRPLYDDGASKAKDATREYVLKLDAAAGAAPLLTVYGGKLTTYRTLAEAALKQLAPLLGGSGPWTRGVALPGGDFAWDGADQVADWLRARWPFLDRKHAARLVRAYGTRAHDIFAEADREDVATTIGGRMTVAEIRYLMRREWARTPEDILWRRSKLGLHLNQNERAEVARVMSVEAPLPA